MVDKITKYNFVPSKTLGEIQPVYAEKYNDLVDHLTDGYVVSNTGAVTNLIKFTGTPASTNTDGTILSTGSTWIVHSTVGSCAFKILASYSATSGDYATLRIRARADGTIVTNPVGVVAGNFAASANVNDYANLYAVQGYAQPLAKTQALADNIVCGLYSCIQATASSSGSRWSTWIDTHETTKASGGDYLLRLSHNGTIANDGCITVYNGGRMPVLFNFEDAAGFLTETGSPGSTAAGYLAVKTPAGTKYIALLTT
jgi:hypothetical protein